MAINMEPQGRFGVALTAALNDKGMSLRDLAAKLDMTYEHMRKLITNRSRPERLTLKEICRIVGLDFKSMEELVVQDKMDKEYGNARYTAFGQDPRLKELAPFIPHLSDVEFKTLLGMVKGMAREHTKKG